MRNVMDPQRRLGSVDIGEIELDLQSRDDVPKLLRGLQHIYTQPRLRERVFAILREVRPQRAGSREQADAQRGRPGMAQWKILVLGVLRLGLNADYDRIHELANQHGTLRQMLGHDPWADQTRYKLQTLKDNLRLFTPAVLDRINQEVVRAGHEALGVDAQQGLNVRCDSFVVETDVHYPTDINLLWDALRKTIEICTDLSQRHRLDGWRQSAYQLRQAKRLYRQAQQCKHSTSQDEDKRRVQQEKVRQAHQDYLSQARQIVRKAEQTRDQAAPATMFGAAEVAELNTFIGYAWHQIDLIDRRVLQGQKIPHEEKVFSLFEPHTEWISKGKAGVPVELGLRVAVAEDQHRFILLHLVMQRTTDDAVAVPLVEQVSQRFGKPASVSMDKGFHSRDNQVRLAEVVELPVVPRKGRLSEAARAQEGSAEFIRLRRQHSAVESAINALEVHGLDRCPDHGITGFKRYAALAVVARNVLRLGDILMQQDKQALNQRMCRRQAA